MKKIREYPKGQEQEWQLDEIKLLLDDKIIENSYLYNSMEI